MSSPSRFRSAFRRPVTAPADDTTTEMASSANDDKQIAASTLDGPNDKDEQKASDLPTEDAQRGVRTVEAITLTWTKGSLICVFIKYVFSQSLAL